MKISQKGLYALEALMTLGRRYGTATVKIRDIAIDSDLPEKFGYRLRRAPAEIKLSEIIRLIDGPLAPFGDADQLRGLITTDPDHRALYSVFLEVRDAAAKILDSTSVADIAGPPQKHPKPPSARTSPRPKKKS